MAGRFQGLHYGHLHLIQTALAIADRVIVLLGSAQEQGTVRNPFSVTTRDKMIHAIFPHVIVEPIHDLNVMAQVNRDWGFHVLNTCKQFTRKIPNVIIFGGEPSNSNWFSCHPDLEYESRFMTEVIVSRHLYGLSGTMMREFLFNDDFEKWKDASHPKLHKHYDELRAELLNAKEIIPLDKTLHHAPSGWQDKEPIMKG